ncbi:unnamed protein product [Moneuplotes crassus]|uniref:Uncharacterized protein n=1 Tax=Euplotes crassus TaxID=5936 RepID=A0AAD1XQ80_EUPCR|nr:unnamed protein product [Moneuplotes crassus]
MEQPGLYLRRCKELWILHCEKKRIKTIVDFIEAYLDSLSKEKQSESKSKNASTSKNFFLRRIKKLMKYYSKGVKILNLNASHFCSKDGKKVLKLIEAIRPREIMEYDLISPRYSRVHMYHKYLLKDIRLMPFVVNRLKIEECIIHNLQLAYQNGDVQGMQYQFCELKAPSKYTISNNFSIL